MSQFIPSQLQLDKYADVLVNFALNSGEGVKKNEVVVLEVPEVAKPLLISLHRAVLKSGAHPIVKYIPDGLSRDFYEIASDHQINFFPKYYLKGKVRQSDHLLFVLAETDLHELENIDAKKIMDSKKALKPYRNWRNKKENEGNLTWTLGLYPTQAAADEAKMTIEDYWGQIVKACFLDEENPVKKWQEVFKETAKIKEKLENLKIKNIRLVSENTDLSFEIGESRSWAGGGGRNIPSFEIFTSPDWRTFNGHISFDQPLYRYGNIIKDIYLEFKNGRIIKSSASQNENILKEMLSVKNADKIGEFSLTDKRFSKINKFMAETLFDENFGGEYGNTHLAIGDSFNECYSGTEKLKDKQLFDMGFNQCVIHTDLVATKNRQVFATLIDGSQIILYENGQFVV